AGFSGTNRYILDYLLEEVLAGQPPDIQHFLLRTSILERLAAPLCDALIGEQGIGKSGIRESGTVPDSPIPDPLIPDSPISAFPLPASQSILEYLERANLFLVPLDDERTWYRYHHLFADLLRTQLQRSLGTRDVAQLHVRASEWHAQRGSMLEAIHHASLAADDERVEHLIEQHYMEMVSRGEMSGMRFWRGKLSKELVHRRPWLCIYEAYSHAWFGELDEADLLLEEAEKRIRSEGSAPDVHSMQGHLAYVKSRVTAMRGDFRRAIELCLAARVNIPAGNLALQFDTRSTLGYEYFLSGDYANASQILEETIRAGVAAGAVIHTVAVSCILARLYANQGLLRQSHDTYQVAAQVIPEANKEHRDARALVEAGIADVLCEWNDLDAALAHLAQGLALLPLWAKVDDLILAYVTLARIRLAQGNRTDAAEAVDKARHLVQTSGVFSEARHAVESAQVKLWLAQGDLQAAHSWAAIQAERLTSDDPLRFENEPAHIARARVFIAQQQPDEAIGLLSRLEEAARRDGRTGRAIEIALLRALALNQVGDSKGAVLALTKCLSLAEPEGYVRLFLDEGQPAQMLLAQWLAHAGAGPVRDYVLRLLSQFHAEPYAAAAVQGKASPGGSLVEALSQRELEVLHLMALGKTNQQIARQLVVAPGTVKAHTASIYHKLDVANRTEAVARARELGILP
ncbi:MAG TPA: LuxR C-terminal-related transcriptional regulator, partial [Anaerolineae bacterium]|nr:LuxR C-terminal-related transcriptional regulator [Anaerolineae bacterium]